MITLTFTLPLQLIGVGLILHEAVYLSARGLPYLTDGLAPVLGLRVPAIWHASMHALLSGASVALILAPSTSTAALSFGVLSVCCASFPRRLPNHLALAWFLLGACVSVTSISNVESRSVLLRGMFCISVVLVYLFAGIHKLNSDFFNPKISCGVGLAMHYLLQKGVELREIPKSLRKAPLVIVMTEIGIPILLVNSYTQHPAVVCAMILHYMFGILAHVHFSVIMIAALICFCPELLSVDLWLLLKSHYLLLLLGMVVGCILGNHVPYRWRALAMANHAIFSGVWFVLFWEILGASIGDPWVVNDAISIIELLFFAALFAVNGLAPYLGFKSGFSFAMFSNLRFDRWTHWFPCRPTSRFQPRYLKVIGAQLNNVKINPRQLSRELAEFDRYLYSIGFLCACVQAASRSGVGSGLWVQGGRDCEPAFLISDQSLYGLPFHERISVFPVKLPISPAEPVCE